MFMLHNIGMSAINTELNFRAFVINLESRKDRLISSQNQFQKLQIPFTRISAVTPDNLTSDDFFVKPAVAACWESHLSVYEIMVLENIDIALICEDDINFGNFDLDLLIDAMHQEQIHVLQIGFLYGTIGRKIDFLGRNFLHFILLLIKKVRFLFPSSEKWQNSPQLMDLSVHRPWLVPADFRFGTHCYLISQNAAARILSIGGIQFLAADDFLVALAKMRFFDIRRLFVSKCGQSNSPSSIL
jgi:GR25 family glycosyltransferase involved in LPS biosynthesis